MIIVGRYPVVEELSWPWAVVKRPLQLAKEVQKASQPRQMPLQGVILSQPKPSIIETPCFASIVEN